MCLDSGHNLQNPAAHFYLGTEQFLRLLDFFAGKDFSYLELHFCKIVIGNGSLGL